MDSLDLKALARLGSVSSGLRDVLQEPIPQQALEHCRAASEVSNRLRDMWRAEGAAAASARVGLVAATELNRVLLEENAVLKEDFAELRRQRLEERGAWQRRVRALEHELATAKRARTA